MLQLASGLKAGGFTLPGEFAVFFRKKQQLPLQDDGVYRQQEQRPPRKIDAETTLVHNNFLYTGSPFKPQIGDIRVSFWANASSHISLIGKQTKPFFGSARAIAAAAAAELKEVLGICANIPLSLCLRRLLAAAHTHKLKPIQAGQTQIFCSIWFVASTKSNRSENPCGFVPLMLSVSFPHAYSSGSHFFT